MASRSLFAYTQTASFSQSTALFAKAAPRANTTPSRGERTLNLGKNKKVQRDTGKRPAQGERKALRKRIVLSNTNAFVVEDLQDLTVKSLATGDMQGKVAGLSEDVVDSLRAVEAFKTTQGWHLFRRPATLMRKETAQVSSLMGVAEAQKKTVRRILVGEKASGKSTLLLQGLAMAFMKKWVVINLPDGMIAALKPMNTRQC
jgi:small subunit ribosomal protein S29